MQFPYLRIRCQYEKLNSLLIPPFPVRLDVQWENVTYEFLINRRLVSRKAVVFGTGSVRGAKELPVFSRARWARNIFASSVYYFDPTIYLGDCDLGWGYGTKDCWYLERIAMILEVILQKIHVQREKVLYYGSSGGGFTSVMLASRLHGKATVVNPQFFVEQYFPTSVNRMKQVVLAPGEELIPLRTDVTEYFRHTKYLPQIHLHQNRLASHDMSCQVEPFRKKLQMLTDQWESLLREEYYEDEGGHTAMPDKAVCLKMIRKDLKPAANGLYLQP